jgi:Zn-dependent protease
METPEIPSKQKKPLGPFAGALATIGIVLYKFKFALAAIFKGLPLLKLGWLLKGLASLFLSLGLYTMVFGWRYAITLIALIYIHEMGHYAWMKVKGLDPKAPVFVPFLGAYVAMNKMPDNPVIHAEVAYAGPFVGGVTAIGLYLWGVASGNIYMLAAANTGLLLNLFQLIPMRPFDGGFIADCITKKLAIAGVLSAFVFGISFHSILLLILSAIGFFILIARKNEAPYTISLFDRLRVSIAYFGLAILLSWYFWISETHLGSVMGKGHL